MAARISVVLAILLVSLLGSNSFRNFVRPFSNVRSKVCLSRSNLQLNMAEVREDLRNVAVIGMMMHDINSICSFLSFG